MIPKFRVFAKAGTKPLFGGGYDRDQMFYEIRDIDFYDDDVTVWGCHNKDCGMCDDTYKMEDVEIMMSTGLKDKDGIEIYEGDVVNITQYFGGHPYGGMKYVVKRSKYNNDIVADRESGDWRATEVRMRFRSSDDYEVIGNIYENKQLLEGQE